MTEDSTERKWTRDKKSEDGIDAGGGAGACKKDRWVSDRKKSQIDWRASRSDRKTQWRANRHNKKEEWKSRRALRKSEWEDKC